MKKQGFKDEDIKSISFRIYTDEVIRESIVVLPSEQEIEEAGEKVTELLKKNAATIYKNPSFGENTGCLW